MTFSGFIRPSAIELFARRGLTLTEAEARSPMGMGKRDHIAALWGEFPIGISFAYRGFRQKAAGEPLDVAFSTEGSGYDLEANALIRKPRIKPEAKTFLDWAISDDVMAMYAKVFPIVATNIPVEAPEGWPADPMSVMIKNDLEWAAQNRQRILDEWSRRYDGKSQPRG